MSGSSVTQQPQSTNSIFTLLPNEYIRFQYSYKPGCFYFSTNITTITNMRLITHMIKRRDLLSTKTSVGKEKGKMIFLGDIDSLKQIQSVIPTNKTKWWIKCLDILTCNCSNERIDWLELCRGTDHLPTINNESKEKPKTGQKKMLIEKF